MYKKNKMSNNEKNITTTERAILKGLNIKAALILQAEDALREAKIPMNPEVLYSLDEESLLELIETWSPENQKILKAKHTKNNQFTETLNQRLHTTNDSKAKDKVSMQMWRRHGWSGNLNMRV